MGLKSAAFPPDDKLADYFGDYAVQGVWADRDAMYYKEFEVDLAQVIPLVMEVGEINEIKAPGEWGRLEIQQGLIGAFYRPGFPGDLFAGHSGGDYRSVSEVRSLYIRVQLWSLLG